MKKFFLALLFFATGSLMAQPEWGGDPPLDRPVNRSDSLTIFLTPSYHQDNAIGFNVPSGQIAVSINGDSLTGRYSPSLADTSAFANADTALRSHVLAVHAGQFVMRSLPFSFWFGIDTAAFEVNDPFPLPDGNGFLIDSVTVGVYGSSVDFSFNIYTGDTYGTATDSLFSSPQNITSGNARTTLSTFKSNSLGYGNLWFAATAVTTKARAKIEFKCRR